MDGKNILEIYNADEEMQKAMHKNQVIWEPDRRIPIMVLFQEIEYEEFPPITEEAVRKCLDSKAFKISYIDGFRTINDTHLQGPNVRKTFSLNPPGDVFICAETHYTLYMFAASTAAKNEKAPYHIFEDVVKQEIDPNLYATYIQPAKDKVGEERVKAMIGFFQARRDEMRETS